MSRAHVGDPYRVASFSAVGSAHSTSVFLGVDRASWVRGPVTVYRIAPQERDGRLARYGYTIPVATVAAAQPRLDAMLGRLEAGLAEISALAAAAGFGQVRLDAGGSLREHHTVGLTVYPGDSSAPRMHFAIDGRRPPASVGPLVDPLIAAGTTLLADIAAIAAPGEPV